jgi:hypothetical protein
MGQSTIARTVANEFAMATGKPNLTQAHMPEVHYPSEISRLTELAWRKQGDTYALPVGREHIVISADLLGDWWVRGIVGSNPVEIKAQNLAGAFNAADRAVLDSGAPKVLLARESRWRNEGPTVRSVQLCRKLRIPIPLGATRGMVSAALDAHFSGRKGVTVTEPDKSLRLTEPDKSLKFTEPEESIWFTERSAASLVTVEDFAATIKNLGLQKGHFFLLSNLHRLRKLHWSGVRSVMRDDKPFTLIATCPRRSDCPADLFNEFSLVLTLQQYSRTELQTLAVSIGKSAGISLEPGAAELIARASDGRPGHVASTLRRLAKAINKAVISEEDVARAFAAFGIAVRSDESHDGVGSIRDLSGVEFESLISGLLTRMGFQAEMTRTTGDGGIDIIAMLDKPIVGGRYLFQCKRFAPENLVGAPTVRDFYGAVTADRAVKGVFITTSSYTAQAREFAEKAGVDLIDLTQLEKLFLEYGLIQLAED